MATILLSRLLRNGKKRSIEKILHNIFISLSQLLEYEKTPKNILGDSHFSRKPQKIEGNILNKTRLKIIHHIDDSEKDR